MSLIVLAADFITTACMSLFRVAIWDRHASTRLLFDYRSTIAQGATTFLFQEVSLPVPCDVSKFRVTTSSRDVMTPPCKVAFFSWAREVNHPFCFRSSRSLFVSRRQRRNSIAFRSLDAS